MTLLRIDPRVDAFGGAIPVTTAEFSAIVERASLSGARSAGDAVILPTRITATFTGGRWTPAPELPALPAGYYWRIRVYVPALDEAVARSVVVPAGAECGWGDLIDVDPDTAEPSATSVPLWEATLEQVRTTAGSVEANVAGATAAIASARDAALEQLHAATTDTTDARDAAVTARTEAGSSAFNAGQSAAAALGHAGDAEGSATAAAGSAEQAAATAATAKGYSDDALAAQLEAQTAAAAADAARSNAQIAASNAATSESDAAGHDQAAATSALSAQQALSAVQTLLASLSVDLSGKLDVAQKGAAGGLATLDEGGRVPWAQLPSTLLAYQGVWDAATNTPKLTDGFGRTGDTYKVTGIATRNLGGGAQDFAAGDLLIYNGQRWEKSDTTDSVTSVAGKVGIVELVAGDVGLDRVDNTSDLEKPISNAVRDVLNDTVVGVGISGRNLIFTTAGAGQVSAGTIVPNLTIGNVSTTAAGTQATATIRGTAPDLILDLTVPKGDQGEKWDGSTLDSDVGTLISPGSGSWSDEVLQGRFDSMWTGAVDQFAGKADTTSRLAKLEALPDGNYRVDSLESLYELMNDPARRPGGGVLIAVGNCTVPGSGIHYVSTWRVRDYEARVEPLAGSPILVDTVATLNQLTGHVNGGGWSTRLAFDKLVSKAQTSDSNRAVRLWDGGAWRSGVRSSELEYGVMATAGRDGRAFDAPIDQYGVVVGDYNAVLQPGMYRTQPGTGASNQPPGAYEFGMLIVFGAGVNVASRVQMYVAHNGGFFLRAAWNSTDWGAWRTI